MSFPLVRTMHKICRYNILSRHVRDALSYASSMEGFNAVTSYLWLCAHTCAAFCVMLHTIRLRCVHQLLPPGNVLFYEEAHRLCTLWCELSSPYQIQNFQAWKHLCQCYQPNFALNSIQQCCDIAEDPFAIWHRTHLLPATQFLLLDVCHCDSVDPH